MVRALAFWVCLALAGALAWFASQTPAPRGVDAPAGAFSAARAMADVGAIARRPHPIGSAEHARVRDHLVRRLTGMGLEVVTQEATVVDGGERGGERRVGLGEVVNIVATLPGRDRVSPAVALMSHYDSVPGSPGAADDGAGVAASLEIARALKAGPQPLRDVVLVITDGEETGLFGARAYFDGHPMARQTGAVVNLEARGGGGRVFMFQTSPKNGELIRLFARTAVNPTSTSLAVFLYSIMPNDTDFTVALEHGKIGLNYAFIGRQFDYHAASATPGNLDQGALQHMGEQALAGVRALADARRLPKPAADAVYADLLGGPILAYPAAVGWLVLAAGAVLGLAAVGRVAARRRIRLLDLAAGLAAFLYLGVVTAAAFILIRQATGVPFGFTEDRPLLARFPHFESALAAAGLAAALLVFFGLQKGRSRVVAAILAALVGGGGAALGAPPLQALILGGAGAVLALVAFGRPRQGWPVWAAFMLMAAIGGAALQALAPATAFIVQWPLLAGAAAAAVAAFAAKGRVDHPASLLAALSVGVPMLAQLIYTAHPVALGVGAAIPAAPAAFVPVAAVVLFPLLWLAGGKRLTAALGVLAALAAAGLALFIRFTDAASPRLPRATQAIYVTEPQAGRAWRATSLEQLDPWTAAALRADGGTPRPGALEPLMREGYLAQATPVPAAAAQVGVDQDRTGRVTVTVRPPPGARELRLLLRSSTPVHNAAVNGRPVILFAREGEAARITAFNPKNGVELSFTPQGKGAVEGRYAAILDGWPAAAAPLPARPGDSMAWDKSDSTAVTGTIAARW
ncbi:MAG TPA: M20/M25/M40 family metallo-hydrolase [Caulobacteraceae bacterium]|jgi:hypothetical protein